MFDALYDEAMKVERSMSSECQILNLNGNDACM